MLKKVAQHPELARRGTWQAPTTGNRHVGPGRFRYCGASLTVLIVLLSCTLQASAQDRSHQVKAVYLYNFGNYVTWPPQSTSPNRKSREFVIGILADQHPVEGVLKKIAQKKRIHGAKIRTLLIQDVTAEWDCQILYIPKSTEAAAIKQALKAVKEKPVLVVGEVPDFATTGGGMIRFYQAQTKIRFEINPVAIRKAEMKASSKLIQIGRAVSQPNSSPTAG